MLHDSNFFYFIFSIYTKNKFFFFNKKTYQNEHFCVSSHSLTCFGETNLSLSSIIAYRMERKHLMILYNLVDTYDVNT